MSELTNLSSAELAISEPANQIDESITGKLLTEVNLLSEGLGAGFINRATEAIQDPTSTITEVGVAAAVGAGLTLMNDAGGGWKFASNMIGFYMGINALGEIANRGKVSTDALIDAWNDPSKYDQSKSIIGANLGAAFFDYPLIVMGAGSGSLGVKSWKSPESINFSAKTAWNIFYTPTLGVPAVSYEDQLKQLQQK